MAIICLHLIRSYIYAKIQEIEQKGLVGSVWYIVLVDAYIQVGMYAAESIKRVPL